jgi:hypothetical protein
MPGSESTQPSEATARRCHCVIAHVQNDDERARVQAALDNALKTNNAHAVYVACLQLLQPCPARDELMLVTS